MTFLDALNQSRIRFLRSNGSPNNVYICCPFCLSRRGTADTQFRFSINAVTGAGHCWHASCGYRARHAICSVLKELSVVGNVQFDQDVPSVPQREPIELPSDFCLLSKTSDSLDRIALRYLIKRGVTTNQIERYGVGVSYCGRYRYRIIFPVWEGQKLRGLVARDFTGNQIPKYLNSPGEKYLWGFDPTKKTVVLAEGIVKSLKIMSATGASSSALLGHSLTPSQRIQIESSQCKHIVLWPDPDRVGRDGVCKVAHDLTEMWNGNVSIVWPVTAPADEMGLEDIKKASLHAAPYSWALDQTILLTR